MLTKEDIIQIKEVIDESIDTKVSALLDEKIETKIRPLVIEIVDKSITEAFADFHANIFEPAVEGIEQDHEEIIAQIKE